MKKSLAACALALATLLPTAQALAWDHKGHMTVALIAYRQLSKQDKAKVSKLLNSHPDLALLRQHFKELGDPDPDEALFVTAARWPDLIRSDPRFFDEEHTDKEPPTKQLAGFPDMKKHKPWHFKDVGFSPDGTKLEAAPAGNNAEDKIGAFRGIIGDPKRTPTERAYYLAWLEHLVGDVHQPLHCAARFTHAHRHGDRGGNDFAIASLTIPTVDNPVTNLHSFWDDLFGDDKGIAAIRTLADMAEASKPAQSASDLNTADWIGESFDAAKSAVYGPLGGLKPDQQGTPTPKVSQKYFDDAKALALQRMKLAGHRLAAVISESLK
ncbi:MAG TPA: S1/P1 nuclease [Pyrinomonadaceae bacterium]|nr:S1/P1 nuclease [Pyrinomonadaceae bacterium]